MGPIFVLMLETAAKSIGFRCRVPQVRIPPGPTFFTRQITPGETWLPSREC